MIQFVPPALNNPFLLVMHLYLRTDLWRCDAPVVLDLFCKAGGAGWGYWLAGYNVVGVDIEPQKNYPFPFIQADAMEFVKDYGDQFDLIHASPPCEGYSQLTPMDKRDNHEKLIPDMRQLLREIGKPYVIENVAGARFELENPLMLCGSMFNLELFRHRYFETEPPIWLPPATCTHDFIPILVSGRHNRKGYPRAEDNLAACHSAMQIWWMTRHEIDKAIPPAFTWWIGKELYQVSVEGRSC